MEFKEESKENKKNNVSKSEIQIQMEENRLLSDNLLNDKEGRCYKIAFFGPSKIGKTRIIKTIFNFGRESIQQEYKYRPTLGCDIRYLNLEFENKPVRIKIFDFGNIDYENNIENLNQAINHVHCFIFCFNNKVNTFPYTELFKNKDKCLFITLNVYQNVREENKELEQYMLTIDRSAKKHVNIESFKDIEETFFSILRDTIEIYGKDTENQKEFLDDKNLKFKYGKKKKKGKYCC
jgi:hypothetical protein